VSIVNRLEPLPSWEVKEYIEHRLKVAGYEGTTLFAPEALETIGTFTEGIPRNVNNFCFNALSLACALKQKVVDRAVVQEVIADLDISKMVSMPDVAQPPAAVVELPPVIKAEPVPVQRISAVNSAKPGPVAMKKAEVPTHADARSYLQEVALKLRNWQGNANPSQSKTETEPPSSE
jgi:hypothetical protein